MLESNWIEKELGHYICPYCGYTFYAYPRVDENIDLYKFCPECGEKMEKEENINASKRNTSF